MPSPEARETRRLKEKPALERSLNPFHSTPIHGRLQDRPWMGASSAGGAGKAA